jgi:hypothetical protein
MTAKKKFCDYKAKDFLYQRKGPWPQPSPEHPLGEAPAVIHLPLKEWFEWWAFIGSRFILTLGYSPIAYLQGLFNHSLDPMPDKEFIELFENSMLAKFICDELDETDQKIFKQYLGQDEEFFILDFETTRVVKPFKGMYTSGTKCLIKKIAGGKYKYWPVAIYIDKTQALLTPDDGAAWELAKYYVLQGAALGITLVVHSILHFPLDSINAITKSSVPKDHILFKLIYPHLRFTLPLESAVLNFDSTVINPKWYKPYSPHPGPAEGLRDLLVDGFKGINGNASYKSYKYPMRPEKIHAYFGEYRDRYYEVFYEFVSKVLQDFDKEDPILSLWAKYISQYVPGFPDEEEIKQDDKLIQAVAYFMWSVTVGHAVDHETYANIGVRKKPMRLRQPPPDKSTKTMDRNKLNTFWDVGKYIMAQILFFKAWTVDRLLDIDYKLPEVYQQQAQKEFFENLHKLDLALKKEEICYMELKNMPSSIQY